MEHFHVALADVKQEREALLAASLLAVHPIQGRLLERRAFSPRDHTAHLPTASKESVALPEQPVGLFVEHKGARESLKSRHHDAPLALLNHMATPHRHSHIASLPCGATPHICKANRQTLRSHRSFAAVTVARRCRLFKPKRNSKKKNLISDMVHLQGFEPGTH